ncbi:MAG TPA: response regulator [Phycisphaerae bacterium]|nr:response regulator [Phycisphaerae bacterium]HRW55811.1 response regulator [Phycisphaerae bacterium]
MSKNASVVRTIRLRDDAINEMIQKLDDATSATAMAQRSAPRYRYSVKTCVMHLQHRDGARPTSYIVTPRDISNTGIGILHGAFLYPGACCLMQLITLHGTWRNAPARIVRCDYIANGVHDVGIEFLEPIDASEYCAEAAPCRVLIVDDNPAIIKLGKALLGSMNADIDSATSGEGAIELASKRVYDAILMDMDMPIIDGFETVKRLRAAGYSGRIVAATGMTQPGDREKCLDAGCDGYIPKPLAREQLIALIKSLRQEPLLSSLSDDRTMAPLIEEFVQNLPTQIRAIEAAYAREDNDSLQTACRNLKGEAGAFGFEPIGDLAARLEEVIIASQPRSAIKKHFEALINLCCQARGASHADAGPPQHAQAPRPSPRDSTPRNNTENNSVATPRPPSAPLGAHAIGGA